MLIIRATRSHCLKTFTCSVRIRNFCDEKKKTASTDTEKAKSKAVKKDESATEKLNKLLASMQTDDDLSLVKKVVIAKPKGGKQRERDDNTIAKYSNNEEIHPSKSDNIFEAAKDVANLITNDNEKKITESELLTKLLNHNDDGSSSDDEKIKNAETLSLNDLIVGMKIDRSERVKETPSRSEFVRKTLAERNYPPKNFNNYQRNEFRRPTQKKPPPNTGSVNLFGENDLNIFKDPTLLKESPDILVTWNQLLQREIKLAVTHPPANHFEKMISWTQEGKLWRFPINNEQGLDEEAKVDFTEHVFIEQHLEGWCPSKGPIRHFMELVCVGLSKNPYITAKDKADHIMWYRNYFEEKRDLLKEIIEQQGTMDKNVKQQKEL